MQDSTRRDAEETRDMAKEAWALMGRKVQLFRDTLATYLIPQEGIEKYAARFTRERQDVINRYIAGRSAELPGGTIENMAELIAEMGFLYAANPGELNYEALTLRGKEFIGDMFSLHNRLLEEARREHYPNSLG